MKTDDLKKLASRFGSVVVLDNDGPSFVVLPFDKYRELTSDEMELADNHFSKISSNGFKPAFSLRGEHQEAEENNSKLETEPNRESKVLEALNREITVLKEEIKSKEAEVEEIP